jgi:hypothetical protein
MACYRNCFTILLFYSDPSPTKILGWYAALGHVRFLVHPILLISQYSIPDTVCSVLLMQLLGPVYMKTSLLVRVELSGSLGQLGVEVARFLRDIYGRDSVIMSDIIKPSNQVFNEGSYVLTQFVQKWLWNICSGRECTLVCLR